MGFKSVAMACGVWRGEERGYIDQFGEQANSSSLDTEPGFLLWIGGQSVLCSVCIHCRFQRVNLLVLHRLCWREENLGPGIWKKQFSRPGGRVGGKGSWWEVGQKSLKLQNKDSEIPERVPWEIMLWSVKHTEQRGFEMRCLWPSLSEPCVKPALSGLHTML